LEDCPDDNFVTWRGGYRTVVSEEVILVLGQEMLQREEGDIVDNLILELDEFQS